jgi:uncharacterized protein (DUF983 family)
MSTSNRQQNSFPRRVIAVLLQRCPRCLKGHVYHGLVAMHEICPRCGYQFGREPGYFMGAMFASYTLAVPILFVIFMVLWHFFSTTWPLTFNLLVTFVVFLPFAPVIFRYSRVIWMHVDYQLDPHSPQRQG